MRELRVIDKTEFRRAINNLSWFAISANARGDLFNLDPTTIGLLNQITNLATELRQRIETSILEFKNNEQEIHSGDSNRDVPTV